MTEAVLRLGALTGIGFFVAWLAGSHVELWIWMNNHWSFVLWFLAGYITNILLTDLGSKWGGISRATYKD